MKLVDYIVLQCIDDSKSNFIPAWYIDYSEPLSRFLDSDCECTTGVYTLLAIKVVYLLGSYLDLQIDLIKLWEHNLCNYTLYMITGFFHFFRTLHCLQNRLYYTSKCHF